MRSDTAEEIILLEESRADNGLPKREQAWNFGEVHDYEG